MVLNRSGSAVDPMKTYLEWRIGSFLLFVALALYMLLPILAVLLYSLATRWMAHILPDGYTLGYWRAAFNDPRLVAAATRSVTLATVAVLIDICVVVPATYWAHVRNRRIRTVVEVAAGIPFALPWVVIGFGVLLLAGQVAPFLLGKPILLMLAHAAVNFPFLYWAVDGAMAAADIPRLSEAAETCGATPLQIIVRVVMPNITAGIVSGGILVFASSFGEFALAQILSGGAFETVPLWSYDALGATVGKFPELAVITFATFILLFVLSAALVFGTGAQVIRLLPGARAVEQRR